MFLMHVFERLVVHADDSYTMPVLHILLKHDIITKVVDLQKKVK